MAFWFCTFFALHAARSKCVCVCHCTQQAAITTWSSLCHYTSCRNTRWWWYVWIWCCLHLFTIENRQYCCGQTDRVMMLQRTTSCLNHRWPQFVIKMGSGTRVWSFLNHSADHATVAWSHACPAPARGTVCSPCHMYVFLFGAATVCSISWNKATSLTGHLHFPCLRKKPSLQTICWDAVRLTFNSQACRSVRGRR